MSKNTSLRAKITNLFINLAILNIVALAIQMFFGISLNLIINLIFILCYIINLIRYKTINKGFIFIFSSIVFAVKLILDVNMLKGYYFRIPINIIIYAIVYYIFDNKTLINNLKKINIFIICFFIINIIMYISKNESFFKNIAIEGSLRYQGFLGDANTFAAISLFLLIISFVNIKKDGNLIYSFMMLSLIMLTGSRGNTLVGIVLLGVNILRIRTLIKVVFISTFGLLFINRLSDVLLQNTTISRLVSMGLNGNGRNALDIVFKDIWKSSSVTEKIFANNITDRYIFSSSNIKGLIYHDFTENSFNACVVFFGVIGGILFLWLFVSYIYILIKNKYNIREIIAWCGILMISLNQDIILNIQMFIFMILALQTLLIGKDEIINYSKKVVGD